MRRPRLTPTVVINPASDSEFARHVRALLPAAGRSPEGLERLLSRRFPRVAVHRRELSSEPDEIWYVYRDGHWTPPTDTRTENNERNVGPADPRTERLSAQVEELGAQIEDKTRAERELSAEIGPEEGRPKAS